MNPVYLNLTAGSTFDLVRYGNIEDLVLEVRVVTGRGLAWQHFDRAETASKVGNGKHKNIYRFDAEVDHDLMCFGRGVILAFCRGWRLPTLANEDHLHSKMESAITSKCLHLSWSLMVEYTSTATASSW